MIGECASATNTIIMGRNASADLCLGNQKPPLKTR